jgi:hypothetical protein
VEPAIRSSSYVEEVSMHTELRIDGANCPVCLNATLEALRSTPGVRSAVTSSSAGCLAIDHDDLDESMLVGTIREHLHGVDMSAAEVVMVSVDPLVVDLHCQHHRSGSGSSAG